MTSNMPIGITAAGAYVPARRIERRTIAQAHAWAAPDLANRASGTRAFANWDEDSITMAVEAVRNTLPIEARSKLSRLLLASTTAPFADRHNAGVLATALNLREDLHSLDIGGCQRAGTSALRLALESSPTHAVVVASECSAAKPGSARELLVGDGAAAVATGSQGIIARYLGGRSLLRDFVDHFREAGATYDYSWEERWIRDEGWLTIIPTVLRTTFDELGVRAAEVVHLILPIPDPRAAQTIAREIGVDPRALGDDLQHRIGLAGAAHSLLLLVNALEKARPGDIIVVCGFGQGCDVLVFAATDEIERRDAHTPLETMIASARIESSYLKFMSFKNSLPFDWGMRAELDRKSALTAQFRNGASVMGFVAGRCTSTGAVFFPHPKRTNAASELEACPLADEPARVVSYAADWLAFCPSPPARYGQVQFDIGARLLMEFADDAEVSIGDPLRMVFRIKDCDQARGYRRYFWKAAPLNPSGAGARA